MYEILFKAKKKDKSEWVEGYLLVIGEKSYIICQAEVMCVDNENADLYATEWYEVDKYTICQYTKLNDMYDDKIWENDFVKFEDVGEEGFEYKEGFDYENVAKVVFRNGRWELDNFGEYNSAVYEEMNDHNELFTTLIHSKVIGNVFDNPGLLEE